MILVTVGTSWTPFDRLLEAVDGAAPAGETAIVQHGASRVRPRGAVCVDFLPFEELAEHVRRARVVVTHAGVGSILVALEAGKRPLVVPRRRDLGEAVDDHQLPFAQRLHEGGLVRLVEDVRLLPGLLADADGGARPLLSGQPSELAGELHDYLAGAVGLTPPRGGPLPTSR